jgi:hypothetical protein
MVRKEMGESKSITFKVSDVFWRKLEEALDGEALKKTGRTRRESHEKREETCRLRQWGYWGLL